MNSQGGGSGSGSGSGEGVEPISEQLREFISSDISHCVSKILDERLGVFRAEVG